MRGDAKMKEIFEFLNSYENKLMVNGKVFNNGKEVIKFLDTYRGIVNITLLSKK